MNTTQTLKKLSDQKLLENFSHIVRLERRATVQVVTHLAEIDRRRLYAKEGYSSLFAYIKNTYNFSGSSAYRRIQVARLSLRFPEIMDLLISGKLNLLAICLIEPHMTAKNGLKNGKRLIEQAIGKTKEEIEYLLANQFQKIEKTEDKIRRLPVIRRVVSVSQTATPYPHSMRDIPKNISHAMGSEERLIGPTVGQKSKKNEQTKTIEIRRVKLECVVDEAVAKKLEQAKNILRAKYPKGRLEDILNEALNALLDKKDPSRKLFRRKSAPINQNKPNQNKSNQQKKTTTRHIPADIRRHVWKRDTEQCSYKSPNGKHCGERGNLQLDHIRPFALGGKHRKENLRLLCRTHNLYRAQQTFGISQRQ